MAEKASSVPVPDPDFPRDNRAFRYGDGIFTSLRLQNGIPVFWEAHKTRLMKGLGFLGIDLEAGELEKKVRSFIHQTTKNGSGRMRIQVFRSGEGQYLPTENQGIVHLSLSDEVPFNSPQKLTLGFFSGIRLTHSALSAFKTCNRLTQVLAAKWANENGFDECLLNGDGGIAEGIASNLFIVKDGRILTPNIESGCYPGIMREKVLSLASERSIPIFITSIEMNMVETADEIFLTNAIRGIQIIGTLNGRNLSGENPITGYLQTALTEKINEHLSLHSNFSV